MNKNMLEKACQAAGLKAVRRETMQGYDVFISDGFSATPHVVFKRFGVERNEFPFGCFATIWWVAKGEDKIDVGAPLLFDAFHNPEYPGAEMKQKARINTAMLEASGFLRRRKKAALNV